MMPGGRGTCALALGVVSIVVGCGDVRTPEPVLFDAIRPDLFGDGGALTDAWADIDLDGDPDRFVGFNGTPSRLYRNDLLDDFTEISADVGLAVSRSVRTSAWGDFDGDGDHDLLLGYAGEAPVTALYRNDLREGFHEVASDVGLRLEEGTTRQASWVDFDEDGDLDLFLGMRDRGNLLFRNDGGAFTDVTTEYGVGDDRRTVGALWFDVGDGRLDLLVANMNGDANELLLQGPTGFTPALQPEIAGGGRAVGDDAEGSVRPCVADFDNDGDLDLFFANYGPNGLLERTDDGDLNNVAEALGVANPSRYDTCAWGDFDHDGLIDLYVNGTVGGGEHFRDWLLRREGGEAFVDATPPNVLALNASHGATWVDYDLDGDLDLALAGAAADGMHLILKNLLRPEFAWHSLQVRVLDAEGRATRPGTEVRLYAAGTSTLLGTRIVDSGSGYDAQSDLPVHFGVPGGQPVDVEITSFVGGTRQVARLDGVDPDDFRRAVLTIRTDAAGAIVR